MYWPPGEAENRGEANPECGTQTTRYRRQSPIRAEDQTPFRRQKQPKMIHINARKPVGKVSFSDVKIYVEGIALCKMQRTN